MKTAAWWAAHAAGVLLLCLLPLWLASFTVHIANVAMIYVILSIGLSVALGYGGQINLAQVACFGMGAYTTALLTLHTGIGWWGAFPLSIAAAGLLGLVVSVPSLRVQTHYLGIVTLGLAISFTAILTNWQFAGQAIGLPGVKGPTFPGVNLADERHYYYLILAAMVLVFAIALLMMKTVLGRRFRAMRDDAVAAAHSGVEVPIYRMIAFMWSGAFGGVAGALYAGMIHYVSPDTYSLAVMFLLLAMVIIGGRDNIYGAALGAAVLVYVRQKFESLQEYQQIGYGTLVVLMVVFAPSGLAGLFAGAWHRLAPSRFVDAAGTRSAPADDEARGVGTASRWAGAEERP